MAFALYGIGERVQFLAIDPRARSFGFGTVISVIKFTTESLILAQNERWRRGLGMQVERERVRKNPSKVAKG